MIEKKFSFEEFLKRAINHTKINYNFNELSQTIHNSRLFIKSIAYHSNLALDPILRSYILIQTIISTLPELIEYNGQIRGISSSSVNNTLTQNQKL